MDRISNLREPLMEKILFGLPSKDSIRMSFSSKQWQTLWNSRWNSIPVEKLRFRNCSFSSERMSPEEFVAFVGDSLRRNIPEHEDQKKIVEFELAIDMKDTDVVDRWIKMVTRNYVTRLSLHIRKIRYGFPPAAFDVGVLVDLNLERCTLKKALLIQEHTQFIRLKTLIFGHVDFIEVAVGDVLSRCPLLETLELYFCRNIKHVELCDFPNLKKVNLWNNSDYDDDTFTYKIDLPFLESLHYYENGKPMDMEAVSCNNLKKLHVVTHGSSITDQYIKEVCSKFSFLKYLALKAQSFGSNDVDEIRISGHHLNSLEVRGHISEHMSIILDAPNLVCYEHEDDQIPPTLLLNSVKLESVYFTVHGETHLNSAWFIKLREYLVKFTPCDRLRFRIESIDHGRPYETFQFSLEAIQEENFPPLPKVRQLILKDVPPSSDYTSLIDGLLWSCHPFTISIAQAHHAFNRQFIKFLHKMLTNREELPLCCKECRVKCWRHYLSSVKTKSLCEEDEEDDYGLEDGSDDEELFKILMGLGKDYVFELQWSVLEEDRELNTLEIVF